MKTTCVNCGTDSEGDTCPLCDSVSKTPNMTKSDGIRVAAALGHIACDRIEELESELAEARAEIERLKNKNAASITAHMWLSLRHAFTDGARKGYAHGTEKIMLDQMFSEWINNGYPEARDKEIERFEEIERKDKLIEQMREALRLALPEASSTHCEQTILAALAAERGE